MSAPLDPSTKLSDPAASTPTNSADLSPSLPADRATWTEAHYTEALTHLSSLQDRIDSLRDSIPSLIRPLTAFQPSRQGNSAAPSAVKSRLAHPQLSPGETRASQRVGQELSAAEKRRMKDKALGMLKEQAQGHMKGMRELRDLWKEEGTGALLKAGKEKGGKGAVGPGENAKG
ncbi:Hypothetical protein D9617_15g042850 [Elsinoe fawcettii]|nr:Hypothetical protein D9617_15g042850 [Elsinoe fawcettii]